ncbi:hypothetical protein Hypma_007940 [Hypsizygus marmoreus]|uniref:DUF300-domain-containing protein n=1 Tax=Hypsizygus marmoreus TaxID=39966 RepID=A0A369JR27_HYPMA|nr:hypothetical protein Hypma_007940 [Hypsizygus marmoreus]
MATEPGQTPKETCHRETATDSPPLFQNGDVVFQAHHVGWIVAGFFAIVATVASFWLVNKHLQWYTNKREQRYIVRLLFMVPIYALVSFASFLFWNHSTVLILIRDGYESTVLTSFFYLLLMYLSSDPEEQKMIFLKAGLSREADREAKRKGETLQKWVFPLGFIKWKPQDGLYFLQLMKWGVLQYCVIRPTTTLAAVILNYMGLYCEESWGLGWGHVYITIIVSLSVTIAMYCLIQLYVPVAKNLAPHRPLLKLFAVKAVVFLTFWQATFLSVLSMFGVVKDTKYMTAADINIGIGALLETFEMAIFAFLHIRAFTYKPYRPFHAPSSTEPPPKRTPRLRSLGHAMDFRETFREIWVGWIYILDKMRGKEPTHDLGARRIAHYEEAFGRPRASRLAQDSDIGKGDEKRTATLPGVEVEVGEVVDAGEERQWLGLGDNYGYGLGYIKREKSDGLQVQIERELERRGYMTNIPGETLAPDADPGQSQRRQPSWWRKIYNRLSEHGSHHEGGEQSLSLMAHNSRRRSRRSPTHREADQDFMFDYPETDDPPPLSRVQQHRSRPHQREALTRPHKDHDVLAPLPIFTDPRVSRPWPSPPRAPFPASVAHDTSTDIYSVNTSARATSASHPPLTETTHADSLLGRIFSRSTETTAAELGMLSNNSAPSLLSGSMDDEARARLSSATQAMLHQYYEFGAAGVGVGTQTQYKYQHAPTPSVEIVDRPPPRSDTGDLEISAPTHRRESAINFPLPSSSSLSPTSPSAPFFVMKREGRSLNAGPTPGGQPSSDPRLPASSRSRDHHRRSAPYLEAEPTSNPLFSSPPQVPQHAYAHAGINGNHSGPYLSSDLPNFPRQLHADLTYNASHQRNVRTHYSVDHTTKRSGSSQYFGLPQKAFISAPSTQSYPASQPGVSRARDLEPRTRTSPSPPS